LRFRIRRAASAEVSPCCQRPPGGDVACGVHVSMAGTGGAGFALENRLALTVSESDIPAYPTSLRRVRGRHVLDPTKKPCAAIAQRADPTRRTVQTALASAVARASAASPDRQPPGRMRHAGVIEQREHG
jgi:hypothetical protein